MNRKSKAIIDAAVAMGYGTAEDYSGGSVGATLEEFAAIAAEQGGGGAGGGGMNIVDAVAGENDTFIVENKTLAQLGGLMASGLLIKCAITYGGETGFYYLYPAVYIPSSGIVAYTYTSENNNPRWSVFAGLENNGNIVFSKMA